MSRLPDDRVHVLSEDAGVYKLDTKHRSSVTGYNAFDDLCQLSLEKKVLEQASVRIEDVKAGQVVKDGPQAYWQREGRGYVKGPSLMRRATALDAGVFLFW